MLVASAYFHCLDLPFGMKRGTETRVWSLSIFAIYSEYRAAVREAMCNSGFDRLISWIQAERVETWYLGNHDISLYYELDSGTLRDEISD